MLDLEPTIATAETTPDHSSVEKPKSATKFSTRFTILIRRIHLYAGLFLLPWVFLYGITGAMFNHEGLFPDRVIQEVDATVLGQSPMVNFPTPSELAQQVVQTINKVHGNEAVKLMADSGAEFTNNIMYEVNEPGGRRHVVQMDPVSRSSAVVTHVSDDLKPERILKSVSNISLEPNPLDAAQKSVPYVLSAAGIESTVDPKPFGWTKLNFLAEVNGEPARITYVLKDGHVELTKYAGQHGMTSRQFLMRLHTTHGQPPHWNGRMVWSLILDVMAVAMVSWGVTGVLMWWKIKRTRVIGGFVMAASVATAVALYLATHDFYATTTL